MQYFFSVLSRKTASPRHKIAPVAFAPVVVAFETSRRYGWEFKSKLGFIWLMFLAGLFFWFLVIYLAFVLEKSTRAAAREACLRYRVCYRMVRSVMDRIYRHAMKVRLRGVVEVDDFYVNAGLKGRSYHGKLGRPARCRGLKPPLGRGSYSKDEPMILNLF